jgi:hypothetical protein
VLSKLRKKNMTKNLKEVCQLDNNRLILSVSSSLNVSTSRFLATAVRNNKHKPMGRRWSFKVKVFALSILIHGPKLFTLSSHCFLYLPDEPYSPFSAGKDSCTVSWNDI